MRVVLDTNILVRANIKAEGPAREVLLKIISGNHVLLVSPFLLREVERALAYPRLQNLWRLSFHDIQEHVQFLVRFSELVHPAMGSPVVLRDPNDDPVIYTAVSGRADALCTLDGDFFDAGVVAFCRNMNISVLTDLELLQRLTEGR